MTDFFSSIAEQTVRGALSELAQQDDVARLLQITKNWDFYRGDQIQYLQQEDQNFLLRHPEIKPDERNAILSRLRVHLNYTKLVVQRYINGCYGLEVTRKLHNEANQAIMDSIWKQNQLKRFMVGVQRIAELEGLCAVIPRWKEREGRIKFERYGAQHLIPISLPDDPSSLFALVLSWPSENKWGLVPDVISDTLPSTRNIWRYKFGGTGNGRGQRSGVQKYIEIWTADHVQAYLGKEKLVDIENPYHQIPFAYFRAEEDDGSFFGQTSINDVVAINHIVNRLLSDLVEIIRVHGFSLLFVSGEMTDTLILKPTSFIKLPEKGDAKYLTPNSPIREIQEFIDWFVKRMADTAQVPEATISGGDSSESGFALTIRWLPYLQMLAQKRNLYQESDQELIRLALLVSATHTGQGDPVLFEANINFVDANFTPQPEDQQRARDAFLLERDIITALDLIRSQNPAMDEAQVLAKYEENVAFNRRAREIRDGIGASSDDLSAGLQAEALKARARQKAAEAAIEEQQAMLGEGE